MLISAKPSSFLFILSTIRGASQECITRTENEFVETMSAQLLIAYVLLQVNRGGTLDPATHAYTFWEGVPVKARMAFGQLFAKSSTLKSVAIVQRAVRKMTPEALMHGYGFGKLKLVATVKNVHMSGMFGYVFLVY
jgi:hypothetical protein